MKEMQDNNLFGEDSTPTSPTPMIKEIALRDITQAVDLTEFRKQNHEQKNHCTELLLPRSSSTRGDTDNASVNNDGFEWSSPKLESGGKASTSSSNGICSATIVEKDIELKRLKSENALTSESNHTYSSPVTESIPSLKSIADTNSVGRDHLYDVPSDVHEGLLTPNGDVAPGEPSPKRKEIKFVLETETEEETEYNNEQTVRRLSVPDSSITGTKMPKESRTFHPRKRQTVHGNRRDKNLSNFNVERFSKEELLLMWKSSEVELNEKLQAAVKDKQRLETKLTAMKLHMSTAV